MRSTWRTAISPTPSPSKPPEVQAPNTYSRPKPEEVEVPTRTATAGRQAEFTRLRRAFDAAQSGSPQVVVVSGQAGVGKSHLVREFSEEVIERANIVTFSCPESLDLPYVPLNNAIRRLLEISPVRPGQTEERNALQFVLDGVARLTDDELRLRFADAGLHELRITQEFAAVVADASQAKPTVIIGDDIQWADRKTADLLAHFTEQLGDPMTSGCPVLVILVHRLLTGVASTHESACLPGVAEAIARIERERVAELVELEGLEETELSQLLKNMGVVRPSQHLVHLIHGASAGNPFFAIEIVHQLRQADSLVTVGGETSANAAIADLDLPQTLSDAIDTRLRPLSSSTTSALRVISALDSDFDLDTLRVATALDLSALVDVIDEAERADVIATTSGTYRFAHPLVREALYRSMTPIRRHSTHLGIAERLVESHGATADAHAAEIGHHLLHAGALAPPDLVLHFCRLAGDRATQLSAWGTAGEMYLAVSERCEDPVDRAKMQFWAGFGAYRDHDIPTATAHLAACREVFRSSGEIELWGRALLGEMRARMAHGPAVVGQLLATDELNDYLAATGDAVPVVRAQVFECLSELHFEAGEFGEAAKLGRQALELAEHTGDELVLAQTQFAVGLADLGNLDLPSARSHFEASLMHANLAEDSWFRSWGLGRIPLTLWFQGRLDEADEHARDAAAFAADMHDWSEFSLAEAIRTGIAVARGDFEAMEVHGQRSIQMFERSNYSFTPTIVFPQLVCGRLWQGRWEAALDAIAEWRATGSRGQWTARMLVSELSGAADEISASLDERPRRADVDSPLSLYNVAAACGLVDIASCISRPSIAAGAASALADVRDRGVLLTSGWATFVPRVAAMATLLAGDAGGADRELADAAEQATGLGLGPEAARTILQRAEYLAMSGTPDPGLVADLVEDAAHRFDGLGMSPLADRARMLTLPNRGLSRRTSDEPPQRVILMTDLVGSTALNQRTGNERYVSLLEEHDRLLRRAIVSHGGVEFAHTGDGMGAWFDHADDAVRAGLQMISDLAMFSETQPETPLKVKVGLAVGHPIDRLGNLFGLSIAIAARVCSLADGSEVLGTAQVEAAASKGMIHTEPRGQHLLKGLDKRQSVVSLTARQRPSADERHG